jgi:hypothetical protein
MNEGLTLSAIPLRAFEYTNWCISVILTKDSRTVVSSHCFSSKQKKTLENVRQKEVCKNSLQSTVSDR